MRALLSFFLTASLASAQVPSLSPQEMTARAKALELNTVYVPPPGEQLVHETGAYAKVVCSAVFISGFSQEFAEYRAYTEGDDLRHVDWNVFARTDRMYLKRYRG